MLDPMTEDYLSCERDMEELVFILIHGTLPKSFEMMKLLISCKMRFFNGCKTAMYVHTLCFCYIIHILGSTNSLEFMITPDTLLLNFIKPLNAIIISNGWNKIHSRVCFCGYLFLIKQRIIIWWWITGGVRHDVYGYDVNSRIYFKWEII